MNCVFWWDSIVRAYLHIFDLRDWRSCHTQLRVTVLFLPPRFPFPYYTSWLYNLGGCNKKAFNYHIQAHPPLRQHPLVPCDTEALF